MKIARLFIYSVGALLVLTAAAKFISSTGQARILLERDPVTGFQFRTLFRIVGGIEAIIALTCFFSKRNWLSTGLVAWLATSFGVYRAGLMLVGWHRPCSCLGNLTDAIHITPQVADSFMKAVLACLFIGSYASLFWLWRQCRQLATGNAEGVGS